MLFRLIIILMASFIIYVTKVNGITVSDIYIDSLDQMSVNIVHTNKTNNNVIDKKKYIQIRVNLVENITFI